MTVAVRRQPHGLGQFDGRYLGVDASLNSTGLALLDGDSLRTMTLRPAVAGVPRLTWLRDRVGEVLDGFSPTCVMVEDYAYSRGNRAHQIGEWGGVLRLLLWDRAVPTYEVGPNVVKKFVTGRGDGGKAPVMLGLFKHWNLDVPQEDEADAASLALMGLHLAEPARDAPAYRREALSKVKAVRPLVRARSRPAR